MQTNEDNLSNKDESFFESRKPALIGCLLVILFVIAIGLAIFLLGTLEATPDDINNPGP